MVFILLLKSTALVSRSCQVTVKESLFRRFAWGCSSTLRKSVSPFLDFLSYRLRWLNTVLAVCECMSFAKSWQEKGYSSQTETWQVKNILMRDFD